MNCRAESLLVNDYLSSLRYYQKRKTDRTVSIIAERVRLSIAKLPWFYGTPVRLFLLMIVVISVLPPRTKSDQLPGIVRKMPLFGMINKLVRSVALLTLFDVIPLTADRDR